MKRYIDIDTAIRTAIEMCVKVVGHGITQIDAVNIADAFEDIPTADVILRSELAVHSVQDAATILNLQESNKELEAEVERLQKILDSYALQYGTVMDKYIVIERARAEFAREIFEEIEEYMLDTVVYDSFPAKCINPNKFAELKKKYTEGTK